MQHNMESMPNMKQKMVECGAKEMKLTHNSPAKLTQEKAKEILSHGEVRGEPLSEKQKGLFGLIAGGKKPTRLKK